MLATSPAATSALPLRRPRAARVRTLALRRPELLVLTALSAVLYLWALSRNGVANEYYAAAVKAMSTDWHAFLYGSFDASGAMTVDKPPLALWVQALSVRAFGFTSSSLLVPQALMGVATVVLAYDLVVRRFGRGAAFVAGLVLALTPITVAIARHNNPDALLILCSVAALWAATRALEDGRARWLVWAGVFVGLGFEAKMSAALMVLPGIVAAYLWVAPRGRRIALGQLAAGGAAMTVVGLAWPVLMWLTPAADRPWISGTSDNSIWSLIFGYNGLGRLLGQSGGPSAGGMGGGGVFGGSTGTLRLLNASLGGQAGWWLGFAAVAIAAVAAASRLRRADARTGWLIAVGGSFVVTAVAFSRAEGIFHPYYVALLAPFTAALVGAGYAVLSERNQVSRVLAPVAILAGALVEWQVMRNAGDFPSWVAPVLVALACGVAFVLVCGVSRRVQRAFVVATIAVLLMAPASWSMQTLGHATSGTFPAGGPATTGMGRGPGGGSMFGSGSQALTQAVTYAAAHGGGAIGVSSQSTAASAALTTGTTKIVGLGGFSGRESAVTVKWLASAVQSGKVRWVLVTTDNGGVPQDGRTGATTALAAAAKVGKSVSSVSGLYDLQGKAAALSALAS
jgi:4-amino-4-deoxy-L-arabinose transferase-like glycosyltransferase